jgi:hypothetical protein
LSNKGWKDANVEQMQKQKKESKESSIAQVRTMTTSPYIAAGY